MTEEELAELTRQNREAAERQHEEERLNKGRDELDTLFDPRRQFFRDGQGTIRVGTEGRADDWTSLAGDRMVDSSGREYRIAPNEHEAFYKAAKERGIDVKPMERMALRWKHGIARDEWVNPFDTEHVEALKKEGYVSYEDANAQKSALEYALDPDTYIEGFSNPDTWKDLPKNIVKGTGTAAYSVGTGFAKFIADSALDAAGAVSRALGHDEWQANARAGLESGFKAADDWVAENVWGASSEKEKDAVGLGMGAGKVYGEMGLGLGAVAKIGKWAPAALFALQGFERTEEDPGIAKAGWKGDIVAVANAVAGAAAGPIITKLAGAVGAEPAKAALERTFAESFMRSIGESIHGGAVMGFMEAVNQGGRGIADVEEVVTDENGNQVYDDDGNPVFRKVSAKERVASTLNAFAHGTATIGMLKAFDLGGKLAYPATKRAAEYLGFKRAVSYEVEQARKDYAPKLAKMAETARQFAQVGAPLPQGKGKIGETIKGVTTNGEVVFADGSVYYPPRAERVVAGESSSTSRVIPPREARIVVSDGTILDVNGNVVGIAASGQKLYNDAETIAETYARRTDPSAEAMFTTINPETGAAGPLNFMDFAPEKYRQYVEWMKGGQKGEPPELDADSFLYSRIVALAKGAQGDDLANAAQLALGDIAGGRATVREAIEGLDAAETSFNGKGGRRVATEGFEELLAAPPSETSGDSAQTKAAKLTPVVEGEIRATSPVEDGVNLAHAAIKLVDLSTENGIVPEDVDITGIALPEGQRDQVVGEGAGKATSETPIFLWQNPETGRLEVVDGAKRIAAETAAGAKTVKAVVLRPEDGWKTREDADAVSAVANIRSGSLDPVALVDAFAKLGLTEKDATEAGLVPSVERPATGPDQAYNDAMQRKATVRLALEVANHASPEVRGLVAPDNLSSIAAVARAVNAETFGRGWEKVQAELAKRAGGASVAETRAAAELCANFAEAIAKGRVTAEELFEAARSAASMGREMPTDEAGLRALQEAAANDAASKVPVEGADGRMTTLADAISEAKKGAPVEDPPPAGTGTAAELAIRDKGNGLNLVSVGTTEDGLPIIGCAAFPELRMTRVREADSAKGRTVFVSGLTLDDFTDAHKSYQLAKFLGELGERLGGEGVTVRFEEWMKPHVERLMDFYDSEIVTSKAYETRRDAVIKVLEKSGLAAGVVVDEAAFDAALAANGRRELAVDGLTYGFADPDTGKIYLNPRFFGKRIGLETPIHEFGHLGIIACRSVNRAVFERGMNLALQTDLFKEISKHPDYGKLSEAGRAEEVLAQLIGKRGAERLKAETNKGVVAEIKKWIVDFWHSFAKALGLRDITPEQAAKMSIEDVVDAINAEMMSGRTFGSKPLDLVAGDARAKIERFMKYKPGKDGRDTPRAKAAFNEVKAAWKDLDAFQKAALAAHGGADPSGGAALGTPAAKSWAKVIDSLREWDAWRKRRSKSTKEQMRRNPSAAQKQIVRAGRDFYVENHEADPTSPFAFFVTEGARMLIPGKGDYGFDWWNNMQNGLKAHERKELKRFLAGEGYGSKKGGNDTLVREWLAWRLGRMPTAEEEMNAPSFEEFMDAVMAGEADYQAWKRTGKFDTRADREAREMEEHDELQRYREQRDLDTIAAQQDADRREMERMGDFESERPSRESDYYWNNTDFSRRLRFSRAGSAEGTSAVGTVEANPNLKSDIEAAVNTDRSKGKVLPLRKVVEFSKTPPFLVSLGVPEANIISRADILRKIKRKHLLTDEQIADLPNRYSAPVAVMRDGRNYVILTDMEAPTKTSGEKPVMVYLKAVGDKAKHNFIASAYAREANKEQAYIDLIRSGKLIYMDESRIAAAKLEDATLLQFKPQAVRGDFTSSIPQTGVSAQGENLRMSRSGIFTGTAADYANRSRQGGKDDGPSLLKIGTGEGSQVYGWGLYGSTVRGVAEGYAKGGGENSNLKIDGESHYKLADKGKLLPGELQLLNRLDNVISWNIDDGMPHKKAIKEALEDSIWSDDERAVLKKYAKRIDYAHRNLYEQTFFTDRAPGDESHLLKWYEPVSEEQLGWITDALDKENLPAAKIYDALWDASRDYEAKRWVANGEAKWEDVIHYGAPLSGNRLYELVSQEFWSPKFASEFLARAGIDGVKYPVDSYGGKPVKDGDKVGWNYVSFRDDNIRVDHKWTDGQMLYSRRLGPSALGDGRQRYYEVKFEDAVDKIVKNRKPLSDEHVFISETPTVFKDIGMPALPVMMNQQHILSCYFGNGEGVKAGNMHGLGGRLKLLPKALAKPMMIIANDSNPSSSIIAIVKMQDKDGHTVIAPVEINGIGRSNEGPITVNVVKSAFGKRNIWSEKVAKALRDEVDGKVAVFYVDSNEARGIESRLAREAFSFGKSERQLLSVTKGTVHSVSDFGSPVKGVGAQKDSQQFKRWFDKSQVVDENGEPLVVYHGTGAEFNVFDGGAFFTDDYWNADGYANGERVMECYLSIKNPLVIDCKGRKWDDLDTPYGKTTRDVVASEEARKHDGVIFRNVKDNWIDDVEEQDPGTVYYIHDPAQAKSATDNIGTFDGGNPDIRYSRRLFEFGNTNVGMAPETAVGETTPGARAANRQRMAEERDPGRALWEVPWQLSPNGPGGAPIQKPLALGVAETVRLVEALTGKTPTSFRRTKTGKTAEDSWTSKGRVGIAKDMLRVLDEGDAAKIREKMISEGYFRAESDPVWAMTATLDELEADRTTSDGVFANRMRSTYIGRVNGTIPGGMRGATQLMANEVGRVIMMLPADTGAVGRGIRTLGQGIIADFSGKGKNASKFNYMMQEAADWFNYVYGKPVDAQGNPRFTAATVGAKENLRGTVGEMIGWFLTSSDEMSRRAPATYKNMLDAIEHNKKLKHALDDIRQTALGEGAAEHAMQRVERTKTRQYEKMVEDLEREINTPIGTFGERLRDSFVYNWSNMDGPMYLHMSAAQKARLKDYKTMLKAGRITQQEYDTLVDRDRQAIQSVKLAQLAADRGVANEIRMHLWDVNYVFQEAKAAGVDMRELDRYMVAQRSIETGGRSGEGEFQDPHLAHQSLADQRKRLGARGFKLLEETAAKFYAARERNILEDARLVQAFGKEMVDYWKDNVHYIRTERTLSPEDLARIEANRAKFKATHGKTSDDVIEAVMDAGRQLREGHNAGSGIATWTKALEGSFRPTKDWKLATAENDLRLMKFMERNDYVIKMRDALTALGVEGVHDFAEGDRHIPGSYNERYGVIRYVENGKRRALVVPKIIERGYAKEENSMDGWGSIGKAAHGVFIDWNFAYTLRNFTRNIHSNQANLAGMHADNVSMASRWVLPGVSQLAEMGMTQLARHLPDYVFRNKFMRTLFGQNTNLYYAGQAQRILELYLSPKKAVERQRAADEAAKKGDLAPAATLAEDMKALRFCLKGGALISRFDAVRGGGAADDFMQSHGLDRMVNGEVKKGSVLGRILSAPFRKNAEVNRDLELWAKITATLQQAAHDPSASPQEIGMRVAEGASIPRYESRGSQSRFINYAWNMFFNTALQGTLRHIRAVKTRPGETLGKMAAQSIGPRVFWGAMIMGGGLSAIIKWIFDGDEEKARESSLGGLMDGCNKLRAAAMNNGDYLNKFYKSMPIAKWGNTTINIASPLTDEEKLYIPLVDYATQQALLTDKAQQAGLMPLDPVPDGADALKRTFVGTLIPDIMNNRANPFAAVTMDLLMSWVTNPFDTYRGREIYNRDLWTARNASWADRWAFFKETIKRTAIDTGANSIIRLDRFDVDDGEEAPAAVMTSLRKIPVVSAVASSAFRLSTNGDQYRKRVVDAAFEQENAIKRLRAGDLLRDWIEQGGIDDSKTIGDKLAAWGERYGWDKATQTEVMVKAVKGWQRRLRDIPEYRNAKLFDKIRRSTSPKREMLERWLEMGDF